MESRLLLRTHAEAAGIAASALLRLVEPGGKQPIKFGVSVRLEIVFSPLKISDTLY